MEALKFAIFALVLSGCGVKLKKDLSPLRLPPISRGENLRGAFLGLDGQSQSLENDNGKPTVLVFAQFFCEECILESEHFRDSLADPMVAPSRINLITILVGDRQTDLNNSLADAADFKRIYALPWTVGADPQAELFPLYCPENLTPCTVVQIPGRGIVMRKVGLSSRSEIETYTGAWE